jgi:hypothetical protein
VPLKKVQFTPSINRETTRYTAENGWWDGDKVRFRQGIPEKIGGWKRYSTQTFKGICRSLMPWLALNGIQFMAVGTHKKYYVESGGLYFDITPVRSTATLTNPFATVLGSTTITVTHVAHGATDGSSVIFSGSSLVAGLLLDGEYEITFIDVDTYTIEAALPASGTTTGGGTVTATYLQNIGPEIDSPAEGWGANGFGLGTWGVGDIGASRIRIWSQANFGEDLVFAPRGGPLYNWLPSAPSPLATRGSLVSALPGASDVPVVVGLVTVSDISRFVIAFGCNDYGASTLDPMLIRWATQESKVNWTPSATNQAGSLRLSRGSEIAAYVQIRQEILVLTDVAAYSFQYAGPPDVWGAQLLSDSITVAGPNAITVAEGAAMWMGKDKFYIYNGQVQPIKCDVLRYVYDDLNQVQLQQVVAASVSQYNEVWWFYPSKDSTVPDKYVIYNYVDGTWSIGSLTRYAWVDSGLLESPVASGDDRLLQHENGLDDEYTEDPQPIHAYIESAEFDIDDGDRFAFVRRILPDITFRNSTAANPTATITLYPMKSSGSPLGSSVGGVDNAPVVRSASGTVEQFTQQLNIRVRGRQLVLRIESNQLGTTWQAGSMRLDLRLDGGRG